MLAEENEKNLSSQDDRFALRATVIPSEGRVVIQKKEDVTEEEVTEMGFIGISVMANRRSVAISTTVAEPEKELMRMTSLLSSFSTVIELQGEKAAIDAACRAAGKEAAEIGPFSVSFFRQPPDIDTEDGFYDFEERFDGYGATEAVMLVLCVAVMLMRLPHRPDEPIRGVTVAANIGARYIADINEMFDFCMSANDNEDEDDKEEEMYSGWW